MFSLPLSVRQFVVIVLAFFIGGCASMVGHHKVEDLYDVALGSSPARTYQATFEEARQAALYSMQQTGFENIAEHPNAGADWFVTGEIKYSWKSNGQFAGWRFKTKNQISDRRAAHRTRMPGIENRLNFFRNFSDSQRPAGQNNQDNGFFGFGDFRNQLVLSAGQVQKGSAVSFARENGFLTGKYERYV